MTRINLDLGNNGANDTAGTEVAVRFGFIDAPELDQPGGIEAKEFLIHLIDGRTVWLDILMKIDTGKCVDRYGRIVCVPYVLQQYTKCILKTEMGHYHLLHQFDRQIEIVRNVELEMVLNGWAWVVERYGPDDRYLKALEDARNEKRGMWAWESNEEPWRFKQRKARERQRTEKKSRETKKAALRRLL